MQGGLYRAAMTGDTQAIFDLVADETDTSQRRQYLSHALAMAAWKGHGETVTAICNSDVDIDCQNNTGITALMLAARHCQSDVVMTLLAHGASKDITDHDGRTALNHSILGGDARTIAALSTHDRPVKA